MIPEVARVAKRYIKIVDGDITYQDKRVPLRRRYSATYFEIMVRGHLYLIPASVFAWYWHYDSWPSHPVRHRNGLTVDFNKPNLRLALSEICTPPKIITLRRLTEEEKKAYTGIRPTGA